MARYSIGRSRDNDIVLSDTTVSRQHAEIEDLGGGRFIVRDVGSSRGTLVQRGGNWEDVTETEITVDQPILLGELETSVGALLKEAGVAVSAAAAGPEASVASAATPRAAATSTGGGLSPAAKWTLIGGGIFFVVAVVTAVVLVLVLGDGKSGGLAGGAGGSTGGTSSGTGGGGTTSSNTAFQRACETRMARSPRTQAIAGKICTCIVDGVRKSSAISDGDRGRILKIQNLNSQPQQVSRQSQQAFLKIVIACAKRFRRDQ
jgi:hypothetical protein